MIGWVDGQAGASGDMLLGALVDAGVPLNVLTDAIDELDLGITLTVTQVTRGGIGGTKVDVHAPDDAPARTWAEIQTRVTGRPAAVFERLAHAEASVHRVAIDDVHFHEVGGHDALADIVGVCAGFTHLNLSELHCSPLALGSGQVRGLHGPVPVPGPAVLALLSGVPVVGGAAPMELTTPTGAALLAEWVTTWGALPAMTVQATGCGAGGRDPAELANVLRLVLGERGSSYDVSRAGDANPQVLLECNVDDLDPRLWPHVLTELMTAGAADAWLTPILMKKGRPAYTLSVLCSAERSEALREMIFAQTSSIGLREHPVRKHALPREFVTVQVDGQDVRVKVAGDTATPEWEDVLTAAAALGRSPKVVLAAAIGAVRPQ
jgi:uncharacterized protein (TIGR00299 family) protein